MPEKKKIGKPGAPRTLGVSITNGSMGVHEVTGQDKGTVTHFSYFTSQDTGIDIKLIQLHPLSPEMLELMKKDASEGTEDDDRDLEEFLDTLSWNFSIAGYFGRDEKRKLILRTFVISSKEAAKSFVDLALTFARGESAVSPLVLLKNSEEADADNPEEEPGYTSTLDVDYGPNPPVNDVKLMSLSYALVDDNSDTEFFTTTLELSKFLDLMEKVDARLNPGG